MHGRRRIISSSFFPWLAAALLPLLPQLARADERADLEALRDEVRQERAALAAERKELQEQRMRVDDALAQIEHERGRQPSVSAAAQEAAKRARLEFYGFAMLDAIQDFQRVDPDWKSTLRPSKIPVNCPGDNGCGNNGESVLSPKQSRFGVKGFLPTPLGEMKTRFEFDMFAVGDDAGETNIRLRHAYGELGPILAGQTNSVFMDGDVFPNTIDYWGPAGMVFFRNPQVRYTPIKSEGLEFAVALESPSSAIDAGKASEVAPELEATSWNPYPDFTTHVRLDRIWGHVQAAAILRGLGYQVPANSGNGPDGMELGWGLNLSSALKTIGDDQLLLELTYGWGIASYMNDGGTDLAPDDNNHLNDGVAVPLLGWMAYYNRTWSERWTSSFGFSETRQFTTGGQSDDSFETGQYLSANLLFHPIPQMLVGPEFLWGRRENRNGEDHDDTRVQVSLKYDFSGTLFGGDEAR